MFVPNLETEFLGRFDAKKKKDNFYRLSAVIDIDPALSKNIGPASAHHVIDSDQ